MWLLTYKLENKNKNKTKNKYVNSEINSNSIISKQQFYSIRRIYDGQKQPLFTRKKEKKQCNFLLYVMMMMMSLCTQVYIYNHND